MTLDPIAMFFLLLVGHAVADYPLQADFLARGKNHRQPIPGFPWWILLANHALIHGGAVMLITGSLTMGVAETACHFVIDWLKCEGLTTFEQDQFCHLACKAAWVGLFFSM